MATYGFRVHTIEPRLQRSQSFLQIEDVSEAGGAKDAFERVYAEVLAMQNTTYFGNPTYFQDEMAEAAKVAANAKATNLDYLTVLQIDKADRKLTVKVETGKEQDHDGLRSRNGASEPMKNRAAIRISYVVLIFPKTGRSAFMISEVRGRSYAGEQLLDWMTRLAQRAVVSKDKDGNISIGPWMNWKMTPQIDGERLDGILADSSDHTMKLRRHTVTPQGVRSSYDIELTQMGLRRTTPQKFLDALMNMANRRSIGSEQDRRAAAAKDVLALVSADVSGVGFDDAELSFLERGKRQTINSETVDRLFVYPIGSTRPDGVDLYGHSEKVVKRIAVALKIPLK